MFGQIQFEEVQVPLDFSANDIKKSPVGEYFVTPFDYSGKLFASQNLEDWTTYEFGNGSLRLSKFFDDGTPIYEYNNEYTIRKMDAWSTLTFNGDFIKSTFIKADTLFGYASNKVVFSVDKGDTFISIFETSEMISNQNVKLFKINDHFVLHHRSGPNDSISIYNPVGDLINSVGLDNALTPNSHFSSCIEIIFVGFSNYYLLKEDLTLETGTIHSIVFNSSYLLNTLRCVDGTYFYESPTHIYKADNCSFDWEILVELSDVPNFDELEITDSESIIINDYRGNAFFEKEFNSEEWEENLLQIKYPFITDVDESYEEKQICGTYNNIFSSSVPNSEWTKANNLDRAHTNAVQFTSNGKVYVKRRSSILYSENDGLDFVAINLPIDISDFSIEETILDDGVIYIFDLYNESYYTVNNGQDWIPVNIENNFWNRFKLVGDEIIVLSSETFFPARISKININTNEIITEEIGENELIQIGNGLIADNGTIYFFGLDQNAINTIVSYQFGMDLEFFSHYENGGILQSNGNLYLTTNDSLYHIEEEMTTAFGYIGLPQGAKSMRISQNEHLYVIIKDNRLFRSTEPLSISSNIAQSPIASEIEIFPNPTKSTITFLLPESEYHQIDEVEVINHLGQSVYSNNSVANNSIDIAHLPNGIHTLILYKDDGSKKASQFIVFKE